MRSKTRSAALAVLCAGVLTLGACGSSDDSSSETADATTITWWHNSNNEPGMGYYEQAAKDYEADHPGVKIEISAMAHEDMVDKLDAGFQSGDIPDIYMERGGGELADHVDAGMVRDISDQASRGDRQDRWLRRRLADRRQDLRASVLARGRRRLVQHRPLHRGRHHRAADHDGRVVRRHREAQGCRHHADLRRSR